MAFIYLYICPLFLRTPFFYPTFFGEKAQFCLKLISNSNTYGSSPAGKEYLPVLLTYNVRHLTLNF